MSTYEKPKVEVIKLDKDVSFMTESVQTITGGGQNASGFQPGPAFPPTQTGGASGQNVQGFEP
ncbi:hypothetical protein [Aristaeella lactis]|uniref:Uncharacterized protein n=1 Tax=Aristaeella lactis TaxID=3046383 RepID=A0AC61PJ83_9FIRM|nr:hypothetical protein [Aristaeella lactis]QUA54058.1 hypothetical protein JYE50_05400 [Aristaeella lactis]SMC42818.1 hypothetical protein SAMN06297397_0894 [Aristaeella lactis]